MRRLRATSLSAAPSAANLSRRDLLAGAGAAAFLIEQAAGQPQAQAPSNRPIVFSHTSVVTTEGVRDDVALAVNGNAIAAIGPTDDVLRSYPQAEVYDGRGKALVPGLINCHAHLAATIERGFNEDFGFPNSYKLPLSPNRLLSQEESTLMAVVGALEAIKTGTTTIVEVAGNINRSAAQLAKTGIRCVFAESVSDKEGGGGAMSPEQFAKSEAPKFSAKMRDDGMQRVNDLFSAWHRKLGRISVFPAAGLTESSSPELLHAVRDFAEKHDLGYTIHLNQTHAEIDYMVKYHGVRPAAFLSKYDFLGPRLFAAHCRYVDDSEVALLGRSGTIISHQAQMAGNRGVIPPIPALRAAGCPIANGTDNNTNDLFTVMRVALITERVRRNDATPGLQPQPEDVLQDATQGGARAVRQPKALGSLEVGKKADILVLDTQRIHLVPAVRIVSAWIHNGQPGDIESVMIDGQFVMRNHKIQTMDEDGIIKQADAVGKRVWSKVQESGPIMVPHLSRL
jgi:5-methylthioadenosine/S-adenosylhomocysteine deaminase